MNLNINFWVIIFTCGLVIGIFMMLLFLLFRKKYSIHVQNITVILFLFSLLLFNEIAEESDLVDYYPFLILFTIVIDLLIWPFLLFYVQYITKRRNKYKFSDLKYFFPFIIGLIWQMPFFSMPNENKLTYFSNGIPTEIALFVAFKAIIAIVFLTHIIMLLNKRLAILRNYSIANKQAQFIESSRRLIVIFNVIILFIFTLFFLNYFNTFSLGDSDQVGSLLHTLCIYFFGILVYKNPGLLKKENYSKAIADFISGQEEHYIKALLTLFDEKKPYLNEKLSLKDVADQIGLSNQQLSYLVNRQLGLPFLDFVNRYRVKEVQEHIKNEDHLKTTLLAIAFESGFNSKASFNRIFKNQMGVSPSNYVKNLKIKGSIQN